MMLLALAVMPLFSLDRYEMRMAHYHTPAVMTFEYRLEQVGDHSVTQTHRIYRTTLLERDEILALGEIKIKPKIRIYRNRPNTYAVEAIAPRKATYSFAYMNSVKVENHVGYWYRTTPLNHVHGALVTGVLIDGQNGLPLTIQVANNIAGLMGKGQLTYGNIDGVWVVHDITATATFTAPAHVTKTIREHFSFTNYHFPQTLPAATFGGL